MLNYITLSSFRKHVDLTVRFTPGINAIRAANEQGKSTLLEAVAYAYFGTAGLKESIDDVVTYDTPVSKLKVEHGFTLAGVDYKIVRTAKGAELTFGRETVTGQKEVTKFVEKLFGASQAMSAKLMLARQKDLGGALAEGPTAAGKMIEDLADLDLINQLISGIGEKLPSGNTDVQKSVVSTLREQAAEPELEDVEGLRAAMHAANDAHGEALVAYSLSQHKLDELDVEAAREIQATEKLVRGSITGAEGQIVQAEELLARAPLEPVDPTFIETLQRKVAAQKDLEGAAKLHEQLKRADTTELWDEPLEALHTALADAKLAKDKADGAQDQARAALRDAEKAEAKAQSDRKLEIAKLQGKLVLEESCAFCGKDLKDVPEVALINNPLYAQIQKLKALPAADLSKHQAWFEAEQAEYRTACEQVDALQAVVAVNNQLAPLYARAEKYITLDESVVPAQWTWTGPTGEPQNFSGDLADLQERQRAYEKRATQDEEHRRHLMAQQERIRKARSQLEALPLADAIETLELAETLQAQVRVELELEQRAERELASAKHDLALAEQRNAQKTERLATTRAALAAAEASLAEMEANNTLVKKLRAARPVIADQLWAIVLAASSNYTGDVRGERSAITRADGKFKINGRPVTGLSGSAEDVLGLAIRYALTKTFLPSVDFVILDEVAAACDDQRELAVLGLLATSGFAQTILVTHSDLADSFSDSIITI